MDPCGTVTITLQACITDLYQAIVWLSPCQWSNLKAVDKVHLYLTTTKHNKAKTMGIMFGMLCIPFCCEDLWQRPCNKNNRVNKSDVKLRSTLGCLDQYTPTHSLSHTHTHTHTNGGECPPSQVQVLKEYWIGSKIVFMLTLVGKPDINIWLWYQSNPKRDTFKIFS